MHYNFFLQIILDEIAAEGLEGLTFECLWEYLSAYDYYKTVDNKYKEFLWNFIRNFKDINFYKLSLPRHCNFKTQDRRNLYLYKEDCFVENIIPMSQVHVFKLVSDIDIYGSCSDYDSRILIDDEIKFNDSLTYTNLMEKYGNSLIIVANQELRMSFLGITKTAIFNKSIYAFLEIIARSRYNGIKATGPFSVLEFFKDSSTQWYVKKKLKQKNLIRIQKLNFSQSNNSTKEILVFQLNRFYRPMYNIFEMNLERFLLFISNIHSAGILKSTFLEVLRFSEEFLKRAKERGWVELIMTSYRVLNHVVDLDHIPTDEQLLQFYIDDFCLPDDASYPISLINKRSCFIKPIKSLEELKILSGKRIAQFENDEEPVPDLMLSTKFIGLNLDEPIYVQVLKLIAQHPMSPSEIKLALGLRKLEVRGVLKLLTKNNQVMINFKTIDRHSVPFYTIRQILNPQIPVKESMVSDDENQLTLARFVNPTQLTPALKNPKRQERYDYLVQMVQRNLVFPNTSIAQKIIRDWEASINLKEVMDRKSFKRIIDNAITNGAVTTTEVVFEISNRTFTETWLLAPGVSMDSSIFQEIYLKRIEDLKIIKESKTPIKLGTNYSIKRKSKPSVPFYSSQINIWKELQDVVLDDEITDFRFPEIPLMIRRKLLHEFIWYICIGSHSEPNLNVRSKLGPHGFRIYMDSFGWKRHVAPLQHDPNDRLVTFSFNDLFLRLPLCLICLLSVPKNCNKELYDALMDDNLRWASVENIITHKPSIIAFILNGNKKIGLRKLVSLMESLLNMGLITRLDPSQPIRFKFQASFFLNQQVFLTDTSKFLLPLSDQLIWHKLPRYQWVLSTVIDVINYWENVYNVCTNTRCVEVSHKCAGLEILSSYSQESIRNSDYIANHVISNGQVPPENVENIKQFGAWLPPVNEIKWKNLGPCGFNYFISSWSMIAWSNNRFDKTCYSLPKPLDTVFKQFGTTLFSDVTTNLNSYAHISSLNENLSLILNEVNIVLTAATLLRYEDNLEIFWSKIRLKKWFRRAFKHIWMLKFHTILRYQTQLSSEHDKERHDLIIEAREVPILDSYSKVVCMKTFRDQMATKEPNVIRILLLKLVQDHRFIPQWDTMGLKKFTLDKETPETCPFKMEETDLYPIDVLNVNTQGLSTQKPIYPDTTDTVTDIVMLTLWKFLLSCMRSFNDPVPVDFDRRNAILYRYPKDMLLSVLNSFKNFYVIEPLKACKSTFELVKSGTLDRRLNRYAERFHVKGQTESNQDIFLRQYTEWAVPPVMETCEENSTQRHKCQLNIKNPEPKDVMMLIDIIYAMDDNNDLLDLEMGVDDFLFDEEKYDPKTVCHSSIYNINMKTRNLAKLDWNQLSKNTSLTLDLTDSTYNALYNMSSPAGVWESLSEFISLPSKRSQPKRPRLSDSHENADEIRDFINSGEFGGRDYAELAAKFPDAEALIKHLQKLRDSKNIYLVGINTFNFIGKDFAKPWVIKVPPITKSEGSGNTENDGEQTHSTTSKYFFPEFYRGECGEVKCVTLAEIINRVYLYAYKNTGCNLQYLISDLSVYLGEVIIVKLVEVLHKFEVLELESVKEIEKVSFLGKTMTYEMTDLNLYHRHDLTNVTPHPLCHLKMSHLLSDLSQHFSVNLSELLDKN